MNPLTQCKPTILPLLIAGGLACMGLLPRVHAVVPPPDGGYPNFTTAEGTNALKNLTAGIANTAVGWYSLFSAGAASFNTATGAGTLLFNTADQNTAFGTAALLFNTTGFQNTAVGTTALLNNTTGNGNTATGINALSSNTDGSLNTAFGGAALVSNTTGAGNTATGTLALSANTTGDLNTATGFAALQNNTGESNTATGAGALGLNTTGIRNTAVGVQALAANTTANFNTAIGYSALANTTSASNTAVGELALANNTSGIGNVALGFGAGLNQTTGSGNIYIGFDVSGISGESGACRIGNIRGATTAFADAIPVIIDSAGQLGTQSSSQRFKKDIKPMANTSNSILDLKPVTFHYNSDAKSTPQFGLIAEEVEKVNPDLVVRDKNGEIYTVRYEAVNAMLLNEFLKEHRKVQEQEATIAQLKSTLAKKETIDAHQQKQIETLTAGLQKVSAQLELSNPASQVVNKNQ